MIQIRTEVVPLCGEIVYEGRVGGLSRLVVQPIFDEALRIEPVYSLTSDVPIGYVAHNREGEDCLAEMDRQVRQEVRGKA